MNKIMRYFVILVKSILISFKKFFIQDSLLKASALAFNTFLTFIPMLTVGFALLTVTAQFQEKKDEFFLVINQFIKKNNIALDMNPYLDIISNLFEGATQIGSIGFIFLIFTGTAVFRVLESIFDEIWRVETHKSFWNKLVVYFFILIISPLLFTGSVRISNSILKKIQPINYNDFIFFDNKYWIIGDKGYIGTSQITKYFRLEKPKQKTELELNYSEIECINDTITEIGVCQKDGFNEINFVKIDSYENILYVLSERSKFAFYENSIWKFFQLPKLKIRDAFFINEDLFVILFKEGKIGLFNKKTKSLLFKETYQNEFFKQIFPFDKNSFLGLTDKNLLFKIKDQEISVFNQELLVEGFDFENLYFYKNSIIGITKNKIIKLNSQFGNLNELKFSNIKKSFHIGNKLVIHSGDDQNYLFDLDNYSYHKILILENKSLNELKLIPNSKKNQLQGVGNAETVFYGDYTKLNMKTFSKNLSIIYLISRFLLIATSLFFFFYMIYTLIPNAKVPFYASFFGSLLSSIVFIIFLYLFKIYITSFSEVTLILYKALAIIPLFSISLYCLSLIILFGAHFIATIQYKEYKNEEFNLLIKKEKTKLNRFFNYVYVLKALYELQRSHKKPISREHIYNYSHVNKEIVLVTIQELEQDGLIVTTSEGGYLPVISENSCNFSEIYKKLNYFNLDKKYLPDSLRKELKEFEDRINKTLENYTMDQN